MKICVPVLDDNGNESKISEHFGHAPYFAFVDIKEGKKENLEIKQNPFMQHGPGEIPKWVNDNGVDLMIMRGVGTRAISFFNSFGIDVIKGAEGTVGSLIDEYLQEKLKDTDYGCGKDGNGGHHNHHEEGNCRKDFGKVVVPLEENSLESEVNNRFARAKYFGLVNSETGDTEIIENDISGEHGVGPMVISRLAEKGVNTLIAFNLGQNATQAAQYAKMAVYNAVKGKGIDNVNRLWDSKLDKAL